MSRISKLKAYIKHHQYVKYKDVEHQAELIGEHWRTSTWERGLRNSKVVEAVGADPNYKPAGNNPIVAYRYIKDKPLVCKHLRENCELCLKSKQPTLI